MVRRSLVRILFWLTVLVIVVGGAALAVNAVAVDKPIVGARIGDAGPVQSFFETDQATDALIAEREAAAFLLVADDVESRSSWLELQVGYDRDETAEAVRAYGRSGSRIKDLSTQIGALVGLGKVPLPAPHPTNSTLDDELTQIANEITQAPVDAYLTLDDGADQVRIEEEVAGVELDEPGAREAILLAIPDPESETLIELPVTALPAGRTADQLADAREQAQTVVGSGLAVAVNDAHIDLSRQSILAALDFEDEPAGTTAFNVNPTAFSEPIAELVAAVSVEPKNRVLHGDRVVEPGVAGRTVDVADLHVQIAEALQDRASGKRVAEISVPAVVIEPTVVVERPTASGGRGLVYLTFDDGPGAYTNEILSVLKKGSASATFYVLGQRVQHNPESARRIVAEGHRIANHSMDHPDLTTLSKADLRWQIGETQRVIREVTGATSTGFRPPYGAANDTVRSVVAEYGLSFDLWEIDPKDWMRPGPDVITERILSQLSPGAVILLHVQHPGTLEALPGIIDDIRDAGYAFG